jgi:hypothetical protein
MASDDDEQPPSAPPATTEFQNKLEEQAKAKGGLSYTYFAAKSGSAAAAPTPAPAPLSADEAAAIEQQAKAAANGSAWNAAGTYEERDVSAWARARVQALLLEAAPGKQDVEVATATCTGEAQVLHVRGRRRAAFELAVTIVWRAAGGPDVGGGTAKTREDVTGDDIDDEGDVELTVTVDGGGGDAAALQARARDSLRALLCERLRRLRQEMRDGLAS